MSDSSAVNGQPQVEEQPNVPKKDNKPKTAQQKLDAAAEQFAGISKKLGSEDAKAFFELHSKGVFDEEQKEKDKSFDRAKELAKEQKLDLTHQDRSKFEVPLPARPSGYGAAYLKEDWEIKSISSLDNPVSLNGTAWESILSANRVLHGWLIGQRGTVSKARRAAFQLKPVLDKNGNVSTVKDEKGNVSNEKAIPDFEVHDPASITIKETKSEVERSLANNGFSSEAIQGSVSAGGWGASLAVSAGKSTQAQVGTSSLNAQSDQEYTASYNFPRARLYVDELDLQLTPECSELVAEILRHAETLKASLDVSKDADFQKSITTARKARDRFFAQYGHVFATTLELGGQLFASRSAVSLGSATDSEKRDSMKLSAAASFAYSGFGVGVEAKASYDKETNTSEKSHSAASSSTSQLAWSARGGNTLLCANPSEWANSLAGFMTWRTLEQSGILTMPDLISRLSSPASIELRNVSEAFQTITQQEFREKPVAQSEWTHKVRLRTADGRYLIINDGKLCLSERGAKRLEAVQLTILDADIRLKNMPTPVVESIRGRSPYFLATTDKYARQSASEGAQIPGMWVDKDGFLRQENQSDMRICRWSFAPAADEMKFDEYWGKMDEPLENGALVKLCCHSYSSGGGFDSRQNIYSTPFWAPTVRIGANGSDLRTTSLTHKYFTDTYTDGEPHFGLTGDWRISWPVNADYDLIARDDDNARTQQCLRDLDCGKADSRQQVQLGKLSRLFAFGGSHWTDAGWTNYMPLQEIECVTCKVSDPMAKDNRNEIRKVGFESEFATFTAKLVGAAVQKAIDAFKNGTKFQEEAVFKLEYIYSDENRT